MFDYLNIPEGIERNFMSDQIQALKDRINQQAMIVGDAHARLVDARKALEMAKTQYEVEQVKLDSLREALSIVQSPQTKSQRIDWFRAFKLLHDEEVFRFDYDMLLNALSQIGAVPAKSSLRSAMHNFIEQNVVKRVDDGVFEFSDQTINRLSAS